MPTPVRIHADFRGVQSRIRGGDEIRAQPNGEHNAFRIHRCLRFCGRLHARNEPTGATRERRVERDDDHPFGAAGARRVRIGVLGDRTAAALVVVTRPTAGRSVDRRITARRPRSPARDLGVDRTRDSVHESIVDSWSAKDHARRRRRAHRRDRGDDAEGLALLGRIVDFRQYGGNVLSELDTRPVRSPRCPANTPISSAAHSTS